MPSANELDPLDDLAASVRARLAAGRSMAALKEAKELAKRAPGPLAEDLLAQAYVARIADLAAQGLQGEARELLQVAAKRFPDAAATWERAGVRAARTAGDLDDLLLAWRDAPDEDARARVALELRATLRDLQAVAGSAILPAADPLRRDAQRLHAAFTAAADGKLAAAEREELRALDPGPALCAWRAFVLALDAFHRHDDVAALAALAQIDEDAGIARGKRLLADLLRAEPLRDDTPAARRVALRVTGGAAEAYAPLADLRSPAVRKRREAAKPLLVGLAARHPRAAARLVWHLRAQAEHDALVQELDRGLGQSLFGAAEWTRLTADLDAHSDPVVGATAWFTWLLPVRDGDALRPLSDVELAEFADHLLPICMRATGEIAAGLGDEVADALAFPERLEVALDRVPPAAFDADGDHLMTCATIVAEGLRRLRARTGIVPSLGDVRQLAEHAIALDPTTERVASALLVLEPGNTERTLRRALLERWADLAPGDVEPWANLASEAIAQGDLVRARAAAERAQSLGAGDEEVLAVCFRLRLLELREPARRHEQAVCGLMLDELAAEPAAQAPLRRAAVVASRVVLGLAGAGDVERALGDGEQAAAAIALLRGFLLDEDMPLPESGSVRQRLALAAFVVRWTSMLGMAWDKAVLPDVAVLPAHMPERDSDRLALCTLGEERGDWDLVLVASGRGLLQDGPLLPRFLLYRALALPHLYTDAGHDADDLRLLAAWHAERIGDRVTVRLARIARRPLDGHLNEAEAAAILEHERRIERGERKDVAVHARPANPRARPPESDASSTAGS